MPPIKVHHLDTSDESWDGPGNEAGLRIGESESYSLQAYAWQDPEGDPETKDAYKFIHHFVDGDGEIGAASVRACITGIAVLNGARGGADIPDEDRQGVWEHLAAHLEDAEIEPPELRARPINGPERRSFPLQELRVASEGGQRKITGYAAIFNVLSVPLWGFRERILNGAFKKTLLEGDIRSVWNHDSSYVLGRTKVDTLHLWEDKHGLGFEAFPPDTQWARDFMVSIERGDVDQMSFSFNAIQEEWAMEEKELVRELVEVHLHEISPVTFPAYPQTVAQLRSMLGIDLREFDEALCRLASGAMTPADRDLMERVVATVQDELHSGPGPASHLERQRSTNDGPGPASHPSIDMLRRRLEIVDYQLIRSNER